MNRIRRFLSIPALLLAVLLAFSACSGKGPADDTGVKTAADPLDPSAALSPADMAPNPDAEMRGVWIATAANIHYPSKTGLSGKELASELDDIIKTCVEAGLNAVFFQVRPSSDALYKSDIFPYAECVSGKQGVAPDGGFDPLGYLVEKAHENEIKVHAWVNPFRITLGSATYPQTDVSALADGNPAKTHPDYTVAYADGRLYYNPGLPEVRELIADGVREMVERYDVDGVVFDDYFYPYPVGGAEYDDKEAYTAYGGGMKLGDWRRENVSDTVAKCHAAVKEADPECEFGVAPFGIWRNSDGTNGGSDTSGFSSYDGIYCDTLDFVNRSIVDYVAPQLYWSFTTSVARYDVLVRWWNAHVQNTGVKLYFSLGDYRYEELEDPDMEIARQVEFARSELAYCGCVHYGYTEIKNNTKGILDELRSLHSRKVVCARVKSNGNPLVISTPQDGTYIDGDYSYIIGSCDPASTLLFNGSKVSLTKSGCFSVQTDLEPGLNEIKFVCDGKEYTHRLYSYKPGPGGYTVMEKYAISTYYPKTEVIVPSGSSFTVSCNAPTDSTVTATLAGKTIVLRPLLGNTGPEPYIAEIYRGTFDFSEYTEGTFDTLGTVTFRAERNGESAEAAGAEFKVLGRNTVIPVEVVNDYAYLQADTDSTFYENCVPQVPGMTEFAVAKKEGFYELRNGKFISEKDVKTSGCVKDPGKFTLRQLLQTSSDSENYSVFLVKTAGSKPAVDAKLDGKKFTVTLFNSYLSDTAVTKGVFSPVVKDVVLKNDAENGSAVISIELYDELNFYGYSFDYIKLESVELFALYINNQPELSEGDLVLSGKTIVLDAGHGGVDKGALGAFGAEGGKNEADINLSVVLKLRDKLEKLGATVILTRDSDVTFDLEDRERFLLDMEKEPDLCVVVHQNSMPYGTNVMKVKGIAAFYCADSGKLLADCLSGGLSASLNRGEYDPSWLTLMMCRNHRFVSALVETGFITSMEEYERMLTDEGIDSTAEGIKNGILEFYARAAAFREKYRSGSYE